MSCPVVWDVGAECDEQIDRLWSAIECNKDRARLMVLENAQQFMKKLNFKSNFASQEGSARRVDKHGNYHETMMEMVIFRFDLGVRIVGYC